MRSSVLTRTALGEDAAWLAGAAAAAVLAGALVGDQQLLRLLLAGVLLLAAVAAGIRMPRALLLALPLWLMTLGLTRRLLSSLSSSGPMDPLLLVGPVALVVLTMASFDRGAGKGRTLLSRAVLAYTVLTLLGAANPAQGSFTAGVTSLIFFVPLLAFWIGRGLVDDALLKRLLLIVAALAIPAALYGLRQTFLGLPSWDANWVAAQGYSALDVGGAIRPFSTFSNAAEYATLLVVSMVIWLRLGPRRFLRPIAVAIASLLAVATFYEASRSPIVMLTAGIAVMVAARRRLPLWGAAVAGAFLLLALPAAVSRLAPSQTGAQPVQASSTLLQHQVQGLANPFDSSSSTAGLHIHLLLVGIESGFTHPLGQGISRVTIAAAKFGGTNANTETDPSNAATALGLPGLLVFLLVFGVGFGGAYKLARRGEPLGGVVLGILTVTALQWLNGGQYAVAFLPWLLLGWVDRKLDGQAAQPEPVVEPASPPQERRLPPAPSSSGAEPRRWNVDRLAALPGLGDEHRFLLVYLRSFASPDGYLDARWDDLVRSDFGSLLEAYDDGS